MSARCGASTGCPRSDRGGCWVCWILCRRAGDASCIDAARRAARRHDGLRLDRLGRKPIIATDTAAEVLDLDRIRLSAGRDRELIAVSHHPDRQTVDLGHRPATAAEDMPPMRRLCCRKTARMRMIRERRRWRAKHANVWQSAPNVATIVVRFFLASTPIYLDRQLGALVMRGLGRRCRVSSGPFSLATLRRVAGSQHVSD